MSPPVIFSFSETEALFLSLRISKLGWVGDWISWIVCGISKSKCRLRNGILGPEEETGELEFKELEWDGEIPVKNVILLEFLKALNVKFVIYWIEMETFSSGGIFPREAENTLLVWGTSSSRNPESPYIKKKLNWIKEKNISTLERWSSYIWKAWFFSLISAFSTRLPILISNFEIVEDESKFPRGKIYTTSTFLPK